MADEPTTRVSNFARRLDQIERMFGAAGYDPSSYESREKFGDDTRKFRDLLERRERRAKWLAGSATAIALAVLTALIVSKGPLLIHLLDQIGK